MVAIPGQKTVLTIRIPIVYGGAEIAFIPYGPFEYLHSLEPSAIEGCVR